jgi:hypothetical protein
LTIFRDPLHARPAGLRRSTLRRASDGRSTAAVHAATAAAALIIIRVYHQLQPSIATIDCNDREQDHGPDRTTSTRSSHCSLTQAVRVW